MTDTVVAPRPAHAASPARRTSILAEGGGWLIASAAIAVVALLPVAALAVIALGGSGAVWRHLAVNVLPAAAPDDGDPPRRRRRDGDRDRHRRGLAGDRATNSPAGAFSTGRCSCRSRCRPTSSRSPISTFSTRSARCRPRSAALLGIASPRDFRLPDIRSMAGAILLFGFVLYPYVYLATRALFLMQARGLYRGGADARRRAAAVFFRVALPLARPAIAVGASLALMETLNDVGASEFLGIRDADPLDLFDLDQPVEPARRGAESRWSCWPSWWLLVAHRALRAPPPALCRHDAAARTRPARRQLAGWRGGLALVLGSRPGAARLRRPCRLSRQRGGETHRVRRHLAAIVGETLQHVWHLGGRHRRRRRPRSRRRLRRAAAAGPDRAAASSAPRASAMRFPARCSPSACWCRSPASTISSMA